MTCYACTNTVVYDTCDTGTNWSQFKENQIYIRPERIGVSFPCACTSPTLCAQIIKSDNARVFSDKSDREFVRINPFETFINIENTSEIQLTLFDDCESKSDISEEDCIADIHTYDFIMYNNISNAGVTIKNCYRCKQLSNSYCVGGTTDLVIQDIIESKWYIKRSRVIAHHAAMINNANTRHILKCCNEYGIPVVCTELSKSLELADAIGSTA